MLGRWEWSLIISECLTDNHCPPQAIERDHSSVETRCTAMLQHWVQRVTPQPTWSALVRALGSSVINRGDIADKVKALPVRHVNSLTSIYTASSLTLEALPVDCHSTNGVLYIEW